MMVYPQVLQTKITPPLPSKRTLARARVTRALKDALQYRLALLQAGAGYGKSTALAVLAGAHGPAIWYTITEGDNDPLIFLLHLCHATRNALPQLQDLPIPFLENWEGRRGPLPGKAVIDMYINSLSQGLSEPALLIFDDFPAALAPEIELLLDRLIGLAPTNLHSLLAARSPVRLPNLSRWQAQGDVLSIDQSLLAFEPDEIHELFSHHYGYELAPAEVAMLSAATEGWAIALQLIWQGLRSGASASVEAALSQQAGSLDSLFDILASEVFERQPEDVREFMRITATLRELTPEACDFLLLSTGEARSPSIDEVSRPGPPSISVVSRPSGLSGEARPEAGRRLPRPGQKAPQSAAMLAYLNRQELFVVSQGSAAANPDPGSIDPQPRHNRLRYHKIFHRFLREQATPEQRHHWHAAAASYFLDCQNWDEAIYHLIRAEDAERAASLLDEYGSQLIETGRLDTLTHYLHAIPPAVLQGHAQLLFYLGDLARLHSRFEEAAAWYQQAESIWRERNEPRGVSKALRGQARIYLDTLNPGRAEELLQKALRLSDGTEDRESQARLYELLSENKLNAGQAEEAERLRGQAQNLREEGPSDAQLLFRVLLRTGRLDEARGRLEQHAEQERSHPVQTPRAHRETLHLLSLIYAFQGLGDQAYQAAVDGTRRGVELDSPFVTAVGFMRQGHALMLPPAGWSPPSGQQAGTAERFAEARRQFEKAIEISRSLSVPRLRVEAYWGLCRAYGYQGDPSEAMQYAQEGVGIANQFGDEWVASLVRLAMGAGLVLALRYEAAEQWLSQAAKGFQECSDPFGYSAARLWQCLAWHRQGDLARLEQFFPEALSACRDRGYDVLFTRPTLLGLPDERLIVPLLLDARQLGWEPAYISHLLNLTGLPDILFHPGYRLYVSTLGSFQVWRGAAAIPQNGWRREKARQLFQVLITYRQAPLDRDQIVEFLWPGLDPDAGQRNFKVALNTLYHVLEPGREAGAESAYVLREGSTYALRPGSDVWIDAQAFMELIEEGDRRVEADLEAAVESYENAVALYQGDYLPEARYETWAASEREHLTVHFLRAADRLSGLMLKQERFEDAVRLCQRILSVDNCWERAYRHLMLAFHALGDQGQVARAYRRCQRCLREELNVEPAPETERLYKELIGKNKTS